MNSRIVTEVIDGFLVTAEKDDGIDKLVIQKLKKLVDAGQLADEDALQAAFRGDESTRDPPEKA